MKILIGTHNKNKLDQFKRIFERLGSNIELLSLDDLGIQEDVEEDNDNLLDNAKKKAEHYGEKSKILTLADDTGLFVDALNGEPGVHTKRWHSGGDKDRYMKILEKMKDIPKEKRNCHYEGVLVLYDPDKKSLWVYEQNLEGIIASAPHEGNGFGYDPIVIISGKYYSEFTDEERYKVSHRGLGVKELLKYLSRTNF